MGNHDIPWYHISLHATLWNQNLCLLRFGQDREPLVPLPEMPKELKDVISEDGQKDSEIESEMLKAPFWISHAC